MAYTKDTFKTLFQHKFNLQEWQLLLSDYFNADRIRKSPESLADDSEDYAGYFLGDTTTTDHYKLGFFYYKMEDGSVLRRKVGLRNLIKPYLRYGFDAALAVFDDGNNWRLSLICDLSDEATNTKRFTYVFGDERALYKTPVSRFFGLRSDTDKFQSIREAFSVDALSDDFFDEYRKQYAEFVKFLTGKEYVKRGNKWVEQEVGEPDAQFVSSFGGSKKMVRDYIKKMMGRIVFLYFLQSKGWLAGNLHYMHDLFYSASDSVKADFLDKVLEPMFFGLLNTKPEDRANAPLVNGVGVKFIPQANSIPYLNGGLFQQEEIDKVDSRFPAEMFKSLFDFFDSYNFTIDENDPNDAEVGVDPEMLGKIFENLLEDNKDKGAYYTPKEIVRHMCRQSLVAYLSTDVADEAQRQAIAGFVRTYDVDMLGGCASELAKLVDGRLKNVKICDPAIGSGAFPMGLLKELFLCRGAIENFENAADIKRHIIQKNIYGVDYERGAVDIAHLRFWLSLVVDEETPHTLPNLDFKIMQGNSLLEWFEGVDLRAITGNVSNTISYRSRSCSPTFIKKWLDQYFETDNHEERVKLRGKISGAVINFIESNNPALRDKLFDMDVAANSKFFLWHTWFSDVFDRETGNGGFDIVIGNPPYGAKLDAYEKAVLKTLYETTQSRKDRNNHNVLIQKASMDTYTMFIELAYRIMRVNGCMTMIVPISLTSSDSLSGVHRILTNKCDDIYISSYAVRPQPVFKNAVVNTSILAFRKTEKPCHGIHATKMYRKGKNFNLQALVDNLQFVEVKDFMLFGRIPKISMEVEKNILGKLAKCDRLAKYVKKVGEPIYYRTSGGRYFKVVTNYSTGSSKEKPIVLDKKYTKALGCILSSNLSFWFYQIYSNNLDWKGGEIENTPIPPLSDEVIEQLNQLYEEYLADIEANANKRQTTGKSSYTVDSFKEYKIGKSKAIIDKIDDLICPLYGLSTEEAEFIKGYELEFRMSGEND